MYSALSQRASRLQKRAAAFCSFTVELADCKSQVCNDVISDQSFRDKVEADIAFRICESDASCPAAATTVDSDDFAKRGEAHDYSSPLPRKRGPVLGSEKPWNSKSICRKVDVVRLSIRGAAESLPNGCSAPGKANRCTAEIGSDAKIAFSFSCQRTPAHRLAPEMIL